MTHDHSKPLEPNSSEPNSSNSQPMSDSSIPESPQPPLAESDAVSEAIEPSAPLAGIPDLQPESTDAGSESFAAAGESSSKSSLEPPKEPPKEPIESVAMTDATQHSTSSEVPESSQGAATPPIAQPPGQASPQQPQPAATASSSSTAPATDTTPAVVKIFKQVWAIVLALTPIVVGVGRSLWRLLLLLAKWIREGWKLILPRIRAVLPEGWNKLPDWAITTVAVALLVFVLWITTLLLPAKAPAQSGDRPPAVSTPTPPQPEPDPARIAKIQEQVATVTDEYAEGLIQSVQANFSSNQLTVKVSDAWYTLAASRQDKLANDILKRSRQLDFATLNLIDSEEELIARSPVVGSKMVIYSRTKEIVEVPVAPVQQVSDPADEPSNGDI